MEKVNATFSPDEIIKLYQEFVDTTSEKIANYSNELREVDVHMILAGYSEEYLNNLKYMPSSDNFMERISNTLKRYASILSDLNDAPTLKEEIKKQFSALGFKDLSVIDGILKKAEKVSENYNDTYASFKEFTEQKLSSLGVVVKEDLSLHGENVSSYSESYEKMKKENEIFAANMEDIGKKIAEDPWNYN